MRCTPFLILLLVISNAWADEPSQKPSLVAKPDAFKTLSHPDCSHCVIEANRRRQELRADDRVLCWRQVFCDGYTNDGAIPIRFFLNTHRVLSDNWGVFVYDPDAGYARGFRPEGEYSFYGWRKGVMVMKGDDGTLYSCLTGKAFQGPKFGHRLEPRATLVTDWGFWNKRYPQALAFTMLDKYQPVELPTEVNEHSRKSRGPADKRLPADTMVLGVWDGQHARAYPLDALEEAGVLYDNVKDQPRVIFWFGATRTAAAYRPAVFVRGHSGGYLGEGMFTVDPKGGAAPFVDKRTGGHWDITGRGLGGGPMLPWLDSVQVKWFAWAAEYPETSIYGQGAADKGSSEKGSAAPDYKPLNPESTEVAKPLGNQAATSRRFGILKSADPQRQQVTLLLDGETEPKVWALQPGAEVWCAGWWGRLDQFTIGDRVWVWFQGGITLLADERSHQYLYGRIPEKDAATFEKRRAEQTALLRKRWSQEGLPGTLIFAHRDRGQVEVMLDHEAIHWGRLLKMGDKVTLRTVKPVPAVVRMVRPWRERTQLLLDVDVSEQSRFTVGQRAALQIATEPVATDDDLLPSGLGVASRGKRERVEWLAASVYCPCGIHDECAGHFFTVAACNAGPDNPCGMAKRLREEFAERIDQGRTDRQIIEELQKVHGAKLLRPHMLP